MYKGLFLSVFAMLCSVSLFGSDIEVKSFQGVEAKPYLEKLRDLYTDFFQAAPFNVKEAKAQWEETIFSYWNNSTSITALVFANDAIVGSALGMPLK